MSKDPAEFTLVDLYSIGHALRKLKVNAFNAINFPDQGHFVMFRVAFPHLAEASRKKVLEIISKAGMNPIRDKGDQHEVFFTFPEYESVVYKKKLGNFEQFDIMELLQEIERKNFFIHGLTSMYHEDPPFDHVTFTVLFHAVDPSDRGPVEDILKGHGLAVLGGGTFLGDVPESDVQFWWKSTRELYMRKVGRKP